MTIHDEPQLDPMLSQLAYVPTPSEAPDDGWYEHDAYNLPEDEDYYATGDADEAMTPAPARKREAVVVNNQSIAAEWLRAELGRSELACLFSRDGALVHTPRIGEDGYRNPSEDERKRGVHHGPAQVRPVIAAQVQALIDVRYQVIRLKEDKETGETSPVPALFPANAANSAVNAASIGEGVPNLRELRGVTHTPILRADGTVLADPGYDQATGLLYLPTDGLVVPAIPDQPTAQQVADAVELILTPVADFPFISDRHRANWVAAMITPLLRAVAPPPYPWFVVTAPQPGSGKTLLAKAIGIVHGLVTRPELPADKEEQRKVISTVLSDTTAPIVLFDNLAGVVRSSVMEALLTSASITDRQLGSQRSMTMSNDRVWMGTGNNVKIGGDLARRTYDIAIDPKSPDPYMRTGFKIRDLEGWMYARRGEYLAALLTVARGWSVAGAQVVETRSDSYARWDGVMRGLLTWSQLGAQFGQDRQSSTAGVSEDDSDWAEFLAEVYRVFKDQPFRAKDILAKVGSTEYDVQAEMLPGDLAEKYGRSSASTAGVAKSLGRWLSNRQGRYADGYTVTAVVDNGKTAKRYQVVPPEAA